VNNPGNGTVPPTAGQPGQVPGTGSGNNGQQQPGPGQGSTPEQPNLPEAPRDIAGHWAEAAILKAIRLGLAEGYEDGSFRAERPVTREELAVLAARWLKSQGQWPTLPVSGQGLPFRDGEAISSWAEEAIAAAVQAGWLEGYEDGSFRPQQEVTRAELAVFMQRVLALKADDSNAALPFADAAEIPSWAAQGIAAAATAGLFQGNEQGRFLPAAAANRAETVSILLRAMK
jgi:flagellar biosynthesis/type III secretory pathway protein FliH